MGRGKVQLKKIENKTNRQVTFCKRKNGLLKKAWELSVLCDAEVALFVFTNSGRLYEFANNSMEGTIEKYNDVQPQKIMRHELPREPKIETLKLLQEEALKLGLRSDTLLNSIRQLNGDALISLGVKDLQQLETRLENGLSSIRSKKEEMLYQEIADLQRRTVKAWNKRDSQSYTNGEFTATETDLQLGFPISYLKHPMMR